MARARRRRPVTERSPWPRACDLRAGSESGSPPSDRPPIHGGNLRVDQSRHYLNRRSLDETLLGLIREHFDELHCWSSDLIGGHKGRCNASEHATDLRSTAAAKIARRGSLKGRHDGEDTVLATRPSDDLDTDRKASAAHVDRTRRV